MAPLSCMVVAYLGLAGNSVRLSKPVLSLLSRTELTSFVARHVCAGYAVRPKLRGLHKVDPKSTSLFLQALPDGGIREAGAEMPGVSRSLPYRTC